MHKFSDWLKLSGRILQKKCLGCDAIFDNKLCPAKKCLLAVLVRNTFKMSKRPAEDLESGGVPLKGGGRPETTDAIEEDVGEFEDDFDDEYESEDEIFEAGVDGRPDAEREAEEKGGTMTSFNNLLRIYLLTITRSYGCGPADFHSRKE